LVGKHLASSRYARLAVKGRQNHAFAAERVKRHAVSTLPPRHVNVAPVRQFMADMAEKHDSGAAKHARSVLRSALDLAIGVTALKVPTTPCSGPFVHPTTHEAQEDHSIISGHPPTPRCKLLTGLTRDSQARVMSRAVRAEGNRDTGRPERSSTARTSSTSAP
jgi:hypothetical protein